MGLLDRFAQWTQDPRTQALLGSLSRNIGGAQRGYLGAALGQVGGEISDYMADLEERRAREEERRRELELEAEDRAMRRTTYEQHQEDRKLAAEDRLREQAEKEAERLAGFARKGTLKAELFDLDMPELVDLVDVDPKLVTQRIEETLTERAKPKEFKSWAHEGKGVYSRTNPDTGLLEQTRSPLWTPDVKEPKEGALTPEEETLLQEEFGLGAKEIGLIKMDPVLGRDLIKSKFPQMFGKGEGAASGTGLDLEKDSDNVVSLANKLSESGGPYQDDYPGAVEAAINRITESREQILESGKPKVPGVNVPMSEGLRDWDRGADPFSRLTGPGQRPSPSPTATPTPVGPDPADEYLLDEEGSLIARASPSPTTTPTRNPTRTAVPSPTPTQVEAQRGGLRKQDPRDVAGQTVGGTVLPDPAFAPPGDAVMTPVHHGGARRSAAVATVSASFQQTLAQAKQVLPKVRGEEGARLIELAMRAVQEGLVSEQEANEQLQALLGSTMATATATATASPTPTPTATARAPRSSPTPTRTIRENAFQRQYGNPWE